MSTYWWIPVNVAAALWIVSWVATGEFRMAPLIVGWLMDCGWVLRRGRLLTAYPT